MERRLHQAAASPGQQPQPPNSQTIFFGPIGRADLDRVVAEAKKRGQGQTIDVKAAYDVKFYANEGGKIIAAIDDPEGKVKLDRLGNDLPAFYAAMRDLANQPRARARLCPGD